VIWWTFTDVSEVLAAYIIRAKMAIVRALAMEAASTIHEPSRNSALLSIVRNSAVFASVIYFILIVGMLKLNGDKIMKFLDIRSRFKPWTRFG
jgi:hypothetical protein